MHSTAKPFPSAAPDIFSPPPPHIDQFPGTDHLETVAIFSHR